MSQMLVRVLAAACLTGALLGMSPARAQEPQPQLSIGQVEASEYPAMTAVVTALDSSGVPLPGLTASQFQAQVNATSLTIEDVRAAQDSALRLAVVVVIDVSGSMAGVPLARAKDAATEFVNSLGPNDEAAIFSFSGSVTAVTPFTDDRAALTAGIASLQALGPTALYDAAQASVAAARASAAPRKAVVLLSDGENDAPASGATLQGSLAIARDAGVPVFSIGIGGADAGYLTQLAEATRGQYVAADNASIADVYANIATLLRNQYVLTLRGPGDPDGTEAVLQLALTVNGQTARASAPFMRGVAPPPPAPTSAPVDGEEPAAGGGGGMLPIILGAVIGVAVLGGGGYLMLRRARNARAERERGKRSGRQSDAPVPAPVATPLLTPDERRPSGRIIEMSANGAMRTFDVSGVPLTIGSGPRCEVRVDPAPDVAPEHAVVWARDGKLMLRHVGGARRKTTVDARPVDWVILEDGDVFAVGSYRFRAERLASQPTG